MPYRKYILIALLVIVSAMAFLLSKTINKISTMEMAEQKLRYIPQVKLWNLDSSLFQLPAEKPTVFIYFNTECDHCLNEIREIEKAKKSFVKATLVLMSSESIQTIKEFSRNYDWTNGSDIFFTKILSEDLANNFGTVTVPHIFIYGSDKNLIKEFKGETRMEAILEYIQ